MLLASNRLDCTMALIDFFRHLAVLSRRLQLTLTLSSELFSRSSTERSVIGAPRFQPFTNLSFWMAIEARVIALLLDVTPNQKDRV